MSGRVLTALAVAALLLIPATPFAMWVYAQLASADRGRSAAANAQLVDALARYPGSEPEGSQVIAIRKWDGGEGLVPVERYRTDANFGVPRYTSLDAVVHYFDRRLSGWTRTELPSSCAVYGKRVGCKGRTVEYRQGDRSVELEVTLLLGRASYVLYVSQ